MIRVQRGSLQTINIEEGSYKDDATWPECAPIALLTHVLHKRGHSYLLLALVFVLF